jgi:hypothetical protein
MAARTHYSRPFCEKNATQLVADYQYKALKQARFVFAICPSCCYNEGLNSPEAGEKLFACRTFPTFQGSRRERDIGGLSRVIFFGRCTTACGHCTCRGQAPLLSRQRLVHEPAANAAGSVAACANRQSTAVNSNAPAAVTTGESAGSRTRPAKASATRKSAGRGDGKSKTSAARESTSHTCCRAAARVHDRTEASFVVHQARAARRRNEAAATVSY